MEELISDSPWSTVWRLDGGLWRKRCKSHWRFEPHLSAALAARWPDTVSVRRIVTSVEELSG